MSWTNCIRPEATSLCVTPTTATFMSKGERVLAGVTKFLEGTLRVTVNREKTKIGSPLRLKFLGFSLGVNKDGATRDLASRRRNGSKSPSKPSPSATAGEHWMFCWAKSNGRCGAGSSITTSERWRHFSSSPAIGPMVTLKNQAIHLEIMEEKLQAHQDPTATGDVTYPDVRLCQHPQGPVANGTHQDALGDHHEQKAGTPWAHQFVYNVPVYSGMLKLLNRRIRIRTYDGVRGW